MKTYHIETERLILREIRMSDKDDFFRMDSMEIVHKYLGNNPVKSVDETISNINIIQNKYDLYHIGRWAVIEKKSMLFVGWSGLNYITIEKNNKKDFYDVGFRLLPEFWGKGYATESGKAAIKYGFEEMKISHVIGTCHIENIASRTALEKCGLRRESQFIYNGNIKCDWLTLSKEIWLATQI